MEEFVFSPTRKYIRTAVSCKVVGLYTKMSGDGSVNGKRTMVKGVKPIASTLKSSILTSVKVNYWAIAVWSVKG